MLFNFGMPPFLTDQQRKELDAAHRDERQKRFADRIKAILAVDSGWSYEEVAKILRLDDSTIRRCVEGYLKEGIPAIGKDAYKGGVLKMSIAEESLLKMHLQEVTYASTKQILAYVEEEFDTEFSISGMTFWLRRHGFSYIKPKIVPGKAGVALQKQFLRRYRGIKSQLKKNDKIYFADASHPVHNAVAGYGWMLKGQPKELKTTAGRNRLNLNGALDPQTLRVHVRQEETIDSKATIALLKDLETANPAAGKIYFICDNARYYTSFEVREWVKTSRIKMIHLPAYSPNLNLIERLWKYFRKEVMANQYYAKFTDFKKASSDFFRMIRHKRCDLETLFAENFEILGFA